MNRFSLVAPLFSLMACAPVMGEAPTPDATAPAINNERLISLKIRPAVQACLSYVETGTVDESRLIDAGFDGPNGTHPRTIYEAPDIFVVVHQMYSTCRVTWSNAADSPAATTAFWDVLSDAGFSQDGSLGTNGVYSNGEITTTAQVIVTRTVTFSGLDLILERRAL